MSQATTRPERRGGALSGNPWNLFLLIPFLMLVTPWYNSIEPELFGMPFFYWSQFLWVPIGVVCVAVVHLRTDRDVLVSGAAGSHR
ncbi:MAG: DUF3311 domain-containing protein, partial [Pseudonocardia sp.]|nr:DUF3311 domain-containing protein [Pseudonocardia sp.]